MRVIQPILGAALAFALLTACRARPARLVAPSVAPAASPTVAPAATVVPASTPASGAVTATPLVAITPTSAAWTVYDRPADGFSVALPPTWKQVALDQKTLQDGFDALKQQGAPATTVSGSQTQDLFRHGVRFYGYDASVGAGTTGFATNLNVLRQALSPGTSLDDYVSANVAQLEQTASVVKPVSQQSVTLPAGPGAVLRYQMTADAAGQPISLSLTQYLFVKGASAYIVTGSTKTDEASQYAPIFDQIAQKFRLE